jgi:hypothetical protein
MTLIGTGLGGRRMTGHPVMIVIIDVVIAQTGAVIRKDAGVENMVLPAFIYDYERNNEMIEWFAKYFL